MSTKGTTNTPFRIPPADKDALIARARADGFKTFSAAVLKLIAEYGAGRIDIQPDPPPKD